MESSDEGDADDQDSDDGGVVVLGRDISKPIPIPEDELEIDFDESQFADLDAQAEAYVKQQADEDKAGQADSPDPTRRLAVVNLDWDHVRAAHLYKIFSSLVSPTAPPVPSSSRGPTKNPKGAKSRVARGKVLNVRVYPSQFGKERMAREEKEGPPTEIFKKGNQIENEEDVNELTVFETGDGQDYDEDALRKYQLERLRFVGFTVRSAFSPCLSAVCTGITTPSSNAILLKPRHIFSLSWMERNLSDQQTSST